MIQERLGRIRTRVCSLHQDPGSTSRRARVDRSTAALEFRGLASCDWPRRTQRSICSRDTRVLEAWLSFLRGFPLPLSILSTVQNAIRRSEKFRRYSEERTS